MFAKIYIKVVFVLLQITFYTKTANSTKSQYNQALKEQMETQIITGTIGNALLNKAQENITILTKQLLEERRHQTQVDAFQDILVLDFALFYDCGKGYLN